MVGGIEQPESKKFMRQRLTTATVALIAVIEVVAVLGWWQIGEVRSHQRHTAVIHSLTQYVNLVGSAGFRVAFDPDPDGRDEAREILSISLSHLAQIYVNLSGTADGLPKPPRIERGGTKAGDSRMLERLREDAAAKLRAAPIPQFLAGDRNHIHLRAVWLGAPHGSHSGATARQGPSLKEKVAQLAVMGASLLEPDALTREELLRTGRRIEILSVLEIVPNLNNVSVAFEEENTRYFTRLIVLGGVSMLSMLMAVVGSLFVILLPMERRVLAAQDALEQLNAGLEQTVADRTSELEDANQSLRGEIAERQSAQSALQESETRFRSLFESAPIAIREEDFSQVKAEIDALGIEDPADFSRYLDIHPEFVEKCSERIVMVDANLASLKLHGFDDKADFLKTFTQRLGRDAFDRLKMVLVAIHKGETLVEFETSVTPVSGPDRVVMARWSVAAGYEKTYARILFTSVDITESRQTEERLRQAQKMEAVGQLTGGIAHDFNNLLAVIGGNADLLAEADGNNPAMTGPILRAVKRGAELTQRLLAFSRRQPLQPQAIELGELASNMSDLLTRTLGESIELRTSVPAKLWKAMADPGQVENAILNLAINARDAMPKGGKLTIECANTQLDDASLAGNDEAEPGDFVVLAVSDDGTGMSAEVLAHAFEPFFTTKEVGKGSGLGLSMVYGFAKQSGGHVSIYSDEGTGTTVKLYLPRAEVAGPSAGASRDAGDVPRGQGEVILVIEDDPEVRALAVRILEGLGYQVIDVADAAVAKKILAVGQRVDLVLSDVMLPGGTSGLQFADEARAEHPGIKIIFMSGYPVEAATRGGFVGPDNVLLNKPFERHQLAKVVRDQLH